MRVFLSILFNLKLKEMCNSDLSKIDIHLKTKVYAILSLYYSNQLHGTCLLTTPLNCPSFTPDLGKADYYTQKEVAESVMKKWSQTMNKSEPFDLQNMMVVEMELAARILTKIEPKANTDICTCTCHQKGGVVMHMMACCEFTYEQYINDDGSIDMKFYNDLKKKSNVLRKTD